MPNITGADGRAVVTVAEDAAGYGYVLPKEDSFAVVRISANDRAAETAVTVPPGEASIIIR